MEAVTGPVELKTMNASEIERFVREHLAELEDHEITIRRTSSGHYQAEFYDANEPVT
jgi:hypothetical protein